MGAFLGAAIYRAVGTEETAATLEDARTRAHPERRQRQARAGGGPRQDLSPGT